MEERKKLREIIKSVLELSEKYNSDIDKILFSLGYKVNQEVIIL